MNVGLTLFIFLIPFSKIDGYCLQLVSSIEDKLVVFIYLGAKRYHVSHAYNENLDLTRFYI